MLNDLLLMAKNNDLPKLRSEIAEMEIPNYESWFSGSFGKENGERLGGMYGKSLQVGELQFEILGTELAKQQGEILIEKVDAAKGIQLSPGPWTSARRIGKRPTTRPGRTASSASA